jgi:hypothetical protein
MKTLLELTKTKLKQIIREELLNEDKVSSISNSIWNDLDAFLSDEYIDGYTFEYAKEQKAIIKGKSVGPIDKALKQYGKLEKSYESFKKEIAAYVKVAQPASKIIDFDNM